MRKGSVILGAKAIREEPIMNCEQWSAYRALTRVQQEKYRAARMSGAKHKAAMKRAKHKPKAVKGFTRMAAVARPVGV